MDGTRQRCLATESARVVFQPEGCCRSGSGDSAAVSLRVGRHCSPRPGAARLRLPMRSDGVVFWPPRLGCTGALMCTSLARAARAGAATAGEASHQMHCRRRSTRAARGLIDYGSRVGALCCAVPGSTTSSSRRSPRRAASIFERESSLAFLKMTHYSTQPYARIDVGGKATRRCDLLPSGGAGDWRGPLQRGRSRNPGRPEDIHNLEK